MTVAIDPVSRRLTSQVVALDLGGVAFELWSVAFDFGGVALVLWRVALAMRKKVLYYSMYNNNIKETSSSRALLQMTCK